MAPTQLSPSDAVAALIVKDGRQILLQLRDDKPNIFFPNRWGSFGGAVESGETPEAALLRELREELGVNFPAVSIRYFTEFTFDFAPWGYGTLYRKFYLVDAAGRKADRFVLGEGQKLGYFDIDMALSDLNMVPYDEFALWMYRLAKVGK
ncbi:MAG: NUDIX domain-containing protein [Bdellovibrionales bacterium]